MYGKLHIGAILHLFCNYTKPPKYKFLVLVCLDPKPLLFFINSKVTSFAQSRPELKQCHVQIDAANHPFLDYDSYVDCTEACSFQLDYLTDEAEVEVKGTVSVDVFAAIRTGAENSPLIPARQLEWIMNAMG